MDTANLPRLCPLLAASALSAALLSPCIARAVGIGEVVTQSRLGEPLLAQVELTASAGENIEASCLSLAAPDPNDDEAGIHLLSAKLEIKADGARRYVVVSSREAFNEPFAKLRLQVRCPGMGGLTKTLTILPGLGTVPMPLVAIVAAGTETSARALFGEGARTPRAAPPARKLYPQTIRVEQVRRATLMLKIASGPIDDMRARYLVLPRLVTSRPDELGGIRLKLEWLISSASAAATPPPPIAGTPEGILAPAVAWPVAAAAGPAPQGNPMPQRALFVAGLALAIGALLLLRRRGGLKSRQAALPVLTRVVPKDVPAAIPIVSPRMDAQAPAAVVSSAPQHVRTMNVDKAPPEEVSMLEEAELFALHGQPNKAIELLHEITARNPAHIEARMLLLSVLSALGRVELFEQAARDFLKHNGNSESWRMLQTLGRTLDQGNPLYADDGNPGAAAIFLPQVAIKKRRPIGHILVAMGALPVQGMKNCLADYDPKVHGRFGGYLVSRKLVTLAQLNEALLKQQGSGART